MLARIKGGPHVIAGLIENRGQIGIEKVYRERESMSWTIKSYRERLREIWVIFL
jgi:hypothetical protein